MLTLVSQWLLVTLHKQGYSSLCSSLLLLSVCKIFVFYYSNSSFLPGLILPPICILSICYSILDLTRAINSVRTEFFSSLSLRELFFSASQWATMEVVKRLLIEAVEENCTLSSCYIVWHLRRICQESTQSHIVHVPRLFTGWTAKARKPGLSRDELQSIL